MVITKFALTRYCKLRYFCLFFVAEPHFIPYKFLAGMSVL